MSMAHIRFPAPMGARNIRSEFNERSSGLDSSLGLDHVTSTPLGPSSARALPLSGRLGPVRTRTDEVPLWDPYLIRPSR